MNNRFTIPIAVAVAIHALLLFGFNASPRMTDATEDSVTKVEPFVLPKEEIEIVEHRNEDSIPKGSRNVSAPEVATSTPAPGRLEIPMPVNRPSMPALTGVTNVNWENFGDPKGTEFGTGPIITSGGLDNPPRTQFQASPDYPFGAKKDGVEGDVIVEFVVDETGRVSNPFVVSSTNSIFDGPSVRAVLKWRFEPGKSHGKVVKFRMAVPVSFRLHAD